MPVRSDGSLTLNATARVVYFADDFRPVESIFLANGPALPKPPAWCLAGREPPPGAVDTVSIGFRRLQFWNRTTDFSNAILSTAATTAPGAKIEEELKVRLGVQPSPVALKKLLPQVACAEQNAPLGRAVIGGLVCATFATLYFVPVVYSVLRRKAPLSAEHADPLLDD